MRGQLIGIARPIWSKVVESECRIVWLHDMVRYKLIMRDIETFAQNISDCLRTQEMILKEEEVKYYWG